MWDSPTVYWFCLGAIALAAAVVMAFILRPLLAAQHRRRVVGDKLTFRQQRERLEAKFFDLASQSGKPRGLRWTNCEFADDVSFARDRESGNMTALVAVTISFEAIEDGGMEDVEAVGNLRAATAVFFLNEQRWATRGRVIFNLEPAEAIQRFQHTLDRIRD